MIGTWWVLLAGSGCSVPLAQGPSADPRPWYRDVDGDGFGDPATAQAEPFRDPLESDVRVGEDCDDTESTIHPGAVEIPEDDVDQNCDGLADQCADRPVVRGAVTIEGNGRARIGEVCRRGSWIDGPLTIVRWNTEYLQPSDLACLCGARSIEISQNGNLREVALGALYAGAFPIDPDGTPAEEGWGQLTVRDNPVLQSVQGEVLGLQVVQIVDNPELTDLRGFDDVRLLGRLEIRGNDRLTTLEVFGSLNYAERVMLGQMPQVREIPWLVGLEMDRLVAENLPLVTELEVYVRTVRLVDVGLRSFSIGDRLQELRLERMPITELDLLWPYDDALVELVDNRELQTLRGTVSRLAALTVVGHPSLTELDLPYLAVVDRDLVLADTGLVDLQGLPTLSAVRGTFELRDQGALHSTGPGLPLREAGGLRIEGNPRLADVLGFGELTRLGSGGLVVLDNPELPEADIQALRDQLSSIDGPVVVSAPSSP